MMADRSASHEDQVSRLAAWMRANILIEEAFISALSELLHDQCPAMREAEVRAMGDLIRHHRVGLIKQRAVLGAIGLGV